jgi:stage V sporulation protein K
MANDIFGSNEWQRQERQRQEEEERRRRYEAQRAQMAINPNAYLFEPPTAREIEAHQQNQNMQIESKNEIMYKEAMKELDALDGMENVKLKIEEALALASIYKAREMHKLKNTQQALHMVFTGNAGTGKTTIARIVGKLFVGAGLLKKGDYKKTKTSRESAYGHSDSSSTLKDGEVPFAECSNADISSAFWGEDEKNMKKKFDEANGGVLFMDEAYSMISRSGHRSGEKVMAVMVQEMENRRDNVCVICAGYPNEMEEFMQYNTGLASRFATVIHFDNYDVPALLKIAETMTSERDYKMSEEYKTSLATRLEKEREHPHFGNARTVRNIIEESIRIHAKRVYDKYGSSPSREILITLDKEDIREYSPIFTGEKIDDPFDNFYKEAVKRGIVSGDKAKKPPSVRNETPRM